MTEASVKNFQLCCANVDLSEEVVLQFGRVAKDRFTLDLKYPMSLFQVYCSYFIFVTSLTCHRICSGILHMCSVYGWENSRSQRI